MRSIAFGLMLVATLLTAAASSQEPLMTGGDLQQLCAGTDHVSESACRIYILGVTQGITVGLAGAAAGLVLHLQRHSRHGEPAAGRTGAARLLG